MPDGSPPPIPLDAGIPPHNVASERAILAAILLGTLLPPELRPEHFYFDAHARIFETMARVGGDIVAVALELKRNGRLAQVGEQRELAWLVLDASNCLVGDVQDDLSAHVELVVEAFRQRRLIRVLQTVAAEMYGGLGADEAWRRVREECAA